MFGGIGGWSSAVRTETTAACSEQESSFVCLIQAVSWQFVTMLSTIASFGSDQNQSPNPETAKVCFLNTHRVHCHSTRSFHPALVPADEIIGKLEAFRNQSGLQELTPGPSLRSDLPFKGGFEVESSTDLGLERDPESRVEGG